jgi:uncharacterized membrane protein
MENTPNQQQAPTPQQPSQNSGSNHGMAILAYLGILIVIPFLTEAHKDPFVKFHIKQGLALIIAEVIAVIIAVIPFLGWILSPIIWIICLVLLIMGIVNAASGKMKELPLVGKIAQNFKF